MNRPLKIYFDGGCRPDPRGMETAVVVRGQAHIRRGLGLGTSMDAEWLALLDALRLADTPNAIFLGDALAVIGQASGHVRCPEPYRRHLDELRALTDAAGPPRIRHIRRTQNLAGIALARLHGR